MAFGTIKGTFQGNAVSISTSIAASTLVSGSGAFVNGDLIFVTVGQEAALSVTTVTDNLSNAYTAVNAGTLSGASVSGRSYYFRATSSGTLSSVTATTSGGTNNGVICAAIIEGPFLASPLDTTPANTTADVTTPFTCPASGTLAQASEVVVAWSASTGNAVWTASSPNLLAVQQASAAVLSVRIGTQAVAATTSVAPEFAGTNPTAGVLGTASFMMAPAAPSGWQRGNDIIKAVVPIWPMVLLATQATSFAAPAPADNNVTAKAWHQPLSIPVAVAKAIPTQPFVPFNTPQIAASVPQGWQSIASAAPPRAVVNASALTFVVAPFAVPSGWQTTQGPKAARQAAAVPTQATSFAAPAPASNSITGFGFYQPLSKAAPVAQARPGLAFVPFNTTQVAAGTPQGWQSITSAVPARSTLKASALTFVAPTFDVPRGWYQPFSAAPTLARAKQGEFSFPLASPVVVTVIPLVLDSDTPGERVVYYQSQFTVYPPVAAPANNVTGVGWSGQAGQTPKPAKAQPTQATSFAAPASASNSVTQYGWYQPLSNPVPVAKARAGNTFVPFNTAQIVAATPQGWQQPLSGAPKTALAIHTQAAFVALPFQQYPLGWFSPLGTSVQPAKAVYSQPTFVNVSVAVPQGWYQQLSTARPVAKVSFTNQPLSILPVAVDNNTTSKAWHQPLSKPVPVARAQQGHFFVPFNTVQVIIVSYQLTALTGTYTVTGGDATLTYGQKDWIPAIKRGETWASGSSPSGTWIPAIKNTEDWTEE